MDNGLTITVSTDKGDLECSVISTFAVNDFNCIALYPKAESADEILLFRYKELDDGIEIINIDNEDDFKAALTAFDGLMDSTEESTAQSI